MLSKLTAPVLLAGTGVLVEVEFNVAVAGLATVLAAPAKLGMWSAMLLAMLPIDGGAEGAIGAGAVGAEPPMEVANPAKDGMLVAMKSVTPARVGKTGSRSDPTEAGKGGASWPEEKDISWWTEKPTNQTNTSQRPGERQTCKHNLLSDFQNKDLRKIPEGYFHNKSPCIITEGRLSQ